MSANCLAAERDAAQGRWRPRALDEPRPYRINATLWAQAGTSISPQTPQHYGRCDDVEPTRTLYDWEPHTCSLQRFTPESVCPLLEGRAVLFVGDSTVAQLVSVAQPDVLNPSPNMMQHCILTSARRSRGSMVIRAVYFFCITASRSFWLKFEAYLHLLRNHGLCL